jgi:hypothetical protein
MFESDTSESSSQYSESEYSEQQLDSVVTSVIKKFIDRAEFGRNKYGTDLDREDLTFLEWVVHAQEEHMDAILYLEKIRKLEIKRLTETSSHTDTWKIVAAMCRRIRSRGILQLCDGKLLEYAKRTIYVKKLVY